MKETLAKYPADAISFSDDNLPIGAKWFKEFMELYVKEINLPFSCQATVNTMKDSVIEVLTNAKLKILRIAMETTNERIRNEVLLRPKYTNKQFSIVANKLNESGIKVVMLNMFCIPTMVMDDCVELFDFAHENKLIMNTNILVPYKGTAMYTYCVENDLLVEGYDESNGIYVTRSCLKGEEMARMVTMQNYTFLLNHVRFMIPVILQLSKLKLFRKFSFKYISGLNVLGMNFFEYLGLFSFPKLVALGVKSYSSFDRS
jgi:radical SAM superfamily enzyme YgiQ (UPF0313 family)